MDKDIIMCIISVIGALIGTLLGAYITTRRKCKIIAYMRIVVHNKKDILLFYTIENIGNTYGNAHIGVSDKTVRMLEEIGNELTKPKLTCLKNANISIAPSQKFDIMVATTETGNKWRETSFEITVNNKKFSYKVEDYFGFRPSELFE